MKNLFELRDHLERFRKNKALFPSYNDLAELVGNYEAELRDNCFITWNIDDVKDVRPSLSDDQCREVLTKLNDGHDANVGINWEVIKIVADSIFPEGE